MTKENIWLNIQLKITAVIIGILTCVLSIAPYILGICSSQNKELYFPTKIIFRLSYWCRGFRIFSIPIVIFLAIILIAIIFGLPHELKDEEALSRIYSITLTLSFICLCLMALSLVLPMIF